MGVFDNLHHKTPIEDLDALASLAQKARPHDLPFDSAIEVGSWAGRTALVLSEYFKVVYCVDHWKGNVHDSLGDVAKVLPKDHAFKTFAANMSWRFMERIIPCVGESRMWAEIWPFPVDLIFIDAEHDYDSVCADIRAWHRCVAKGGILCGHDYADYMPGVKRAVDELIGPSRLGILGKSIWWTRI